jgi:ethanolamine ammonia-lyase small subunit
MTVSWPALRQATPARIGLGRAGTALTTAAQLDFQHAHARARDAVHAALDTERTLIELRQLGLAALHLRSAAADRTTYLRRPDLGRRLDDRSRQLLIRHSRESGNPGQATNRRPLDPSPGSTRGPRGGDDETAEPETHSLQIVFVIADGLSATAVNAHAVPLIETVLAGYGENRPTIGPVAVVEGGRVAIGDEIGGLLDADLVAVLIGERPGLSAADSLGIYVTWQPAPGTVDAARNCLSNIRPYGMPIAEAADALLQLLASARQHRMTGVALSQSLSRA